MQRYVEGQVVLRKQGGAEELGQVRRVGKEVADGIQCGKCEVMHFGRRNGGIDYFQNGKMLRKSETQRDLGVIVRDSLEVSMQVQSAVRKSNAMLAFMS